MISLFVATALAFAVVGQELLHHPAQRIRAITQPDGMPFRQLCPMRRPDQRLIEIAHPKFRESLYEYCEKTKWLIRPPVEVPKV